MPRKVRNWAEIGNPHDERGESPMQGEGECNGRFGVSQREQAAQVVSWCQRNCNQKARGVPKKLQKGPGREGGNCTIAIQRSDATRQLHQQPRTCLFSSDLAPWALLWRDLREELANQGKPGTKGPQIVGGSGGRLKHHLDANLEFLYSNR